jgi:hypothetical protein
MKILRCCFIFLAAGIVSMTAQSIEELQAMIHSGLIDEMLAKAAAIPPDDNRWKKIPELLVQASETRGDYQFLIRQGSAVLARATNPEIRGAVAFSLGVAYWKSGKFEDATAAWAAVIEARPESELADRAPGKIHEITHLRPGLLVPDFTARTTDAMALSAAALRGKVVLLNFRAPGETSARGGSLAKRAGSRFPRQRSGDRGDFDRHRARRSVQHADRA